MNVIHLHLLVNHVPILATWLAVPVLLLALARPRERAGAWAAAILLLVVAGAAGVVTLLTGEPAAELLSRYAVVDRELVHTHEEIGETAGIVAGVTALLALGMRVRAGTGTVRIAATLLVALVSGGVLAWAGNTGGAIRHPEIEGAPPVPATPRSTE